MSETGRETRGVRLRTAANDRRKALDHYQDLKRAGKSARAVVISEDKDGELTILGQMLEMKDIFRLLMVASDALMQIDEKRTEIKPEAHIEPHKRGVLNQAKPREKEIRLVDGVLVPPEGENFISCGECSHPHFFVLHYNNEDRQSRLACSHCGNEIKNIPIFHAEGTA